MHCWKGRKSGRRSIYAMLACIYAGRKGVSGAQTRLICLRHDSIYAVCFNCSKVCRGNLYAAYSGGWSIYALPWSKIHGAYMPIGQRAWWHICYNICPHPHREVTVTQQQKSVLISRFVVNTYVIAYMRRTGYKQCRIYAITQVAYIAYMQLKSWFSSMKQRF